MTSDWQNQNNRDHIAIEFKESRMSDRTWQVYLSGEIHSDWRDQIKNGCSAKDLPIALVAPVTNHDASDDCGVEILGQEDNDFWKDHKGAQVNAIRTRTLIEKSDIVVVKYVTLRSFAVFGEE